jgi:hypothetical protein
MSKMKKGDYVKRKLSGGSLTGPYMQVMHISGDVVYCDVIGSDEPNVRYLKSNLHVITHTNVCVSEQVLMDLKSGKQSRVTHLLSPRWFNLYEQQPKLITFYCLPKHYKYTFVIDNLYSYVRDAKRYIGINISNYLR